MLLLLLGNQLQANLTTSDGFVQSTLNDMQATCQAVPALWRKKDKMKVDQCMDVLASRGQVIKTTLTGIKAYAAERNAGAMEDFDTRYGTKYANQGEIAMPSAGAESIWNDRLSILTRSGHIVKTTFAEQKIWAERYASGMGENSGPSMKTHRVVVKTTVEIQHKFSELRFGAPAENKTRYSTFGNGRRSSPGYAGIERTVSWEFASRSASNTESGPLYRTWNDKPSFSPGNAGIVELRGR